MSVFQLISQKRFLSFLSISFSLAPTHTACTYTDICICSNAYWIKNVSESENGERCKVLLSQTLTSKWTVSVQGTPTFSFSPTRRRERTGKKWIQSIVFNSILHQSSSPTSLSYPPTALHPREGKDTKEQGCREMLYVFRLLFRKKKSRQNIRFKRSYHTWLI